MSRLKLTIRRNDIGGYFVLVDGNDIGRALTGLHIQIGSGPRGSSIHAVAEMCADWIELDDEPATIVIGDDQHAALVALGWTPPAGENE